MGLDFGQGYYIQKGLIELLEPVLFSIFYLIQQKYLLTFRPFNPSKALLTKIMSIRFGYYWEISYNFPLKVSKRFNGLKEKNFVSKYLVSQSSDRYVPLCFCFFYHNRSFWYSIPFRRAPTYKLQGCLIWILIFNWSIVYLSRAHSLIIPELEWTF